MFCASSPASCIEDHNGVPHTSLAYTPALCVCVSLSHSAQSNSKQYADSTLKPTAHDKNIQVRHNVWLKKENYPQNFL